MCPMHLIFQVHAEMLPLKPSSYPKSVKILESAMQDLYAPTLRQNFKLMRVTPDGGLNHNSERNTGAELGHRSYMPQSEEVMFDESINQNLPTIIQQTP